MTFPFENNNKNIVKKLSSKSFKANRGRNIPALLTIIIAVILMSVSVLIPVGVKKENARAVRGRFQADIISINEDEISKLKKVVGDENAGISSIISTVKAKSYNIPLSYNDSNTIRLDKSSLIGKMPENKNEIIFSSNAKKGLNINIGDIKEFDLGLGKEEYKITGFIDVEEYGGEDRKSYSATVSKEFLEEYEKYNNVVINRNAYFRVPKTDDLRGELIKGRLDEIIEELNISKDRLFTSSMYFNAIERTAKSEILAATLIGIIVLLASGLVIYSIFYISVVNGVREYGRFRVLGASKKQIRSIVRRQGVKLSLIGSLIGIIISGIISYFAVPKGWSFINFLVTGLILIIISLIMVLISLNKPAKIAASTSPIEAIRYSSSSEKVNKNIKGKHKKSNPFNLSILNFKRNKKRIVLTLVSLSFAGIIFMTVGTVYKSISMEKMVRTRDIYQKGDFFIDIDSGGYNSNEQFSTAKIQQDNPLNEKFISRLKSIDGYRDMYIEKGTSINYHLSDNVISSSSISAFDEYENEKIQDILIEGERDYNKIYEDNGVIVCGASTFKEIRKWVPKIGEKITFEFWIEGEIVKKEFTVMGITNKMPKKGWFLIPEKTLKEIVPGNLNYRIEMDVHNEKFDMAETEVRDLVFKNNNLEVETIKEKLSDQEYQANIFLGIGLVICIIVGLFALINLVNTIVTSILSRKEELAILEAVGMTRGQVSKMIYYEGLSYVLFTSISVLTLGTAVGGLSTFLINKFVENPFLDYKFPVEISTIFILVLFIFQIIISVFSIYIYRKEPLADRIKQNV